MDGGKVRTATALYSNIIRVTLNRVKWHNIWALAQDGFSLAAFAAAFLRPSCAHFNGPCA
jgi:hypothetical protein